MSEISNSLRLANEMNGDASWMYCISSCFLSGRIGSSIPTFCLSKIWDARCSFSSSSLYSVLSGFVRKEVWKRISSM